MSEVINSSYEEDHLYSRGYLFSSEVVKKIPKRFKKVSIQGSYFYHDDNTEYGLYCSGNDWVLLYGIVLDCHNETDDLNKIAKNLFLQQKISDNAFLDYIDYFGGRFIIITSIDGRDNVYHDACGNLNVFYFINKDGFYVTSHLGILEDNLSLNKSAIEKEKEKLGTSFRYGYPGLTTPFQDCYQLLPNTKIDIRRNTVDRYYPRKNVEKKTVLQAYNIIRDIFNRQYSILKNKYNILFSLTAGWDSRFTISVLNDIENAKFFTYKTYSAHNRDVVIASEIASRVGLSHQILDCSKYNLEDDYNDFEEVIAKNTHINHSRKISYVYFKELTKGNYLHIRSNLSEIGRLFHGPFRDYSLNELSLYFIWASNNRDYGVSLVARNCFRNYFLKNKVYDCYDYNPYDLFYWEHRMGKWIAGVLNESDPAFNTIQFFNCRIVLDALLGVSEDDRRNDAVYQFAINDRGREELKNLPLNPTDFELEQFLLQKEENVNI